MTAATQGRGWAGSWARAGQWRPLDWVRSIKVKLGLLVVASVVATAFLTWYGLLILGLWPRYTLPIAVVVSLGVTQVLANGMTAPLRRMTAAAREMAAGREPPPLGTTSRDEVGELARAFTAMSRDLAAADAQRRELLANVGHELRTPVTALRAQLENLVDGVRPADAVVLEELLDQADRLGILVDDLLDLARADAGVAPLERIRLDVAQLVNDVASQVSAARPGPLITVDVPAGLRADADPRRLRQVLVNLVDNAARHAPAGHVDVLARSGADGSLFVEVSDDGPGIPHEQREAVFERFNRGSPAAADGGTGLGLAIARWAVSLHGGHIGVVPTPGGGCRIRVDIPRRKE